MRADRKVKLIDRLRQHLTNPLNLGIDLFLLSHRLRLSVHRDKQIDVVAKNACRFRQRVFRRDRAVRRDLEHQALVVDLLPDTSRLYLVPHVADRRENRVDGMTPIGSSACLFSSAGMYPLPDPMRSSTWISASSANVAM